MAEGGGGGGRGRQFSLSLKSVRGEDIIKAFDSSKKNSNTTITIELWTLRLVELLYTMNGLLN